MTQYWNHAAIVLAAVALISAGVALGQVPGGAGSGRGSRGGDTSRSMLGNRPVEPDAGVTANVLAIVKYRLDQLEEDLRLSPEQHAAWQSYREHVIKMAEDTQRAARAALVGEMAAPKRLDRFADIARDRLTALEDTADAGKKLYATLTPAQVAVADRGMAVPIAALAGVEPATSVRLLPPRGGEPAKNP